MEWTPEQQQSLRHETFLAEVEKIRRGSTPARAERVVPWWERLLATTGGAALVTALIAGVAGTAITSVFQMYQKSRDFQSAWLQSRGDQALVSYREYLKGQQDTVKEVYDLVGASIAAGEDVLSITGEDFNPQRYDEESRKKLQAQRTDILNQFTKQDAVWRQKKQTIGFMVSYYHENNKEVSQAWDRTEDSVSQFMDCSRRWYLEHIRIGKYEGLEQVSQACGKERTGMGNMLVEFNGRLRANSQYAWEGWESPEKLRAKLNKGDE
jgi:hypothetical protein